ncbi:M48 family metallopeptidase [Marinobacter zhejiangensis]|uniref:Zn-dependent protease with chaperone function n=1 Tax=Marinobacter zhejiangensis TaxID=488535 RepID=A0A1I4NU78_9GAMM|nr:M48 family metallopeptidase [Marinobacter zhejiangensis]SFM19062.1 Zn-dependent protease with chaperone function [Marinobacter zhejiangensis]
MRKSLSGFYYDGQSSHRQACRMYLVDGGAVLFEGISLPPMSFSELKVPPRIGNTPRTLGLPNGGFFETGDNRQLDEMVRDGGGGGFTIHGMEHKLRYILPLLVLCVAVVYLTVTQGIPYLSERVAYQLSADWSEELGESVLDQLDGIYFGPSETPKSVQADYRALLASAVPDDSDFSYTLYFRDGGLIGANAFALPDGSIVVTDQLLEMGASQDEVLAVMLHEIGHVEHRHSLRALLESSGVAILFTLMTGDAEFVQDFVVALPPLLLQAKFSRTHEWEADTYALERMQAEGMDPIHFATVMEKLSGEEPDQQQEREQESQQEGSQPEEVAGKGGKEDAGRDDEGSTGARMLEYLSTHPPSRDRIDRFRQASEAAAG